MNKVLTTAIGVAMASVGHADLSSANKTLALEEVIITSSPLHQAGEQSIEAVTTLDGDELRNRAASNLGETLSGELGIANASFGAGVGIPVIRGQSGNRVKVLQDNLDTLDASNTSADHAISLEPLLAERIEVLRGPASLRYGSGAIGGVVNVLDNRIPVQMPEALTGGIELRTDSVSNNRAAVGLIEGGLNDIGAGGIAWHLDGVVRKSNDYDIPGESIHHHEGEPEPEDSAIGYVPNSSAEAGQYSIGASYIGEGFFFGGSVSGLNDEYGIPPGAHEHEEEPPIAGAPPAEEEEETVRIDKDQTRYDLKGGWNFDEGNLESLTVRGGYNDYRHIEMEGEEVGTVFLSDSWELRSELVHREMVGWRGAIGLQLSDRDLEAIGDEAFIPANRTRSKGLFVMQERDLGELMNGSVHLELGLRAERQTVSTQSEEISHHAISLSAGVRYEYSDAQSVSLIIARNQRAPTAEELFSDGVHVATSSYDLGDTTLSEESGRSLELGWQRDGDWSAELHLFYTDFANYIYQQDAGREVEDFPLYAYSQRDARFYGVEASVDIPITDNLRWQLNADHVRGKLAADGSGDDNLPRITPMRLGTGLNYQRDRMGLNVQWQYTDRQRHVAANEEASASYSDLRFSLSWNLDEAGNSQLFLRGSNLLDEEMRNANSLLKEIAPEPGRNLVVGARYRF